MPDRVGPAGPLRDEDIVTRGPSPAPALPGAPRVSARLSFDALARLFADRRPTLMLQPLDAGSNARERPLGAAVRTVERLVHRVAGKMADKLAAVAMLHQPGIRIRRLQPFATGAAEHERSIAATVQEQQSLLLRCQRALDSGCKIRPDPAPRLRR